MTFPDFFSALNPDTTPYRWQEEIAELAASGQWPDCLALPTASGKTACVDIAVFAMVQQSALPANQRTAPRRVFFVVDRRVIVDEVYERMKRIAEKLRTAEDGVLKEAADALRSLAGAQESAPVLAYELRGGVYRDHAWVDNPAQPALIASTVDQVGSRLLFRGYGVSASSRPIHAALVANDSLIILDEAHCSRPFGQTLNAIRGFRNGSAPDEIRTPFHLVQMTATPLHTGEESIYSLPHADKAEEMLGKRLRASKPSQLVQVRKPGRDALEHALFEKAVEFAKADPNLKNIVIFVNRVNSARAVHRRLCDVGHSAKLMIGRMRPIDRDELAKDWAPRLKSGARRPDAGSPPLFAVATQCLEVGADYDFDALISECAAIDALRQRFGRLNRTGRDHIKPRAAILAAAGKLQDDPVYAGALHETWQWLQSLPSVDFANEGAGSIAEALDAVAKSSPEQLRKMQAPAKDAPVLFREYLDIWSQTNPEPQPSPDPSHFLHGPDSISHDINVVWRADLGRNFDDWLEIVSLCPPTSPEAMPVSLRSFRKWIAGTDADTDEADIAQPAPEEKRRDKPGQLRPFLIWRGAKESLVNPPPRQLRPGDTVILPTASEGWNELGFIPDPDNQPTPDLAAFDRAAESIRLSKRKLILRIHPAFSNHLPPALIQKSLSEALDGGDKTEIRTAILAWAAASEGTGLAENLRLFATEKFDLAKYPNTLDSYVLTLRRPISLDKDDHGQEDARGDEDDGEDDLLESDGKVSLDEHTQHVLAHAGAYAQLVGLDSLRPSFNSAANMHDWGKADERFQALLLGGDRMQARFSPKLWAKSGQIASSKTERDRQRKSSELPDNFRHEMLSVQLAECGKSAWAGDRDLVLHLIASHHGYARPWAPVVLDVEFPGLDFSLLDTHIYWSAEERKRMPNPHHLDSGVTDRFWRLTRRYGWWGLAYIETIFRLADWKASAEERRKPKIQERAA